MSKVGIVAYILGFIFIGFCFWFVGCSSDSTSGLDLCANYQTSDTTNTEFSEVSDECQDTGVWY